MRADWMVNACAVFGMAQPVMMWHSEPDSNLISVSTRSYPLTAMGFRDGSFCLKPVARTDTGLAATMLRNASHMCTVRKDTGVFFSAKSGDAKNRGSWLGSATWSLSIMYHTEVWNGPYAPSW